ncbi:sensor histidine kinase [Curtobacterium sp. Leaf261]|uniref:sensor histidine kinase n=1 Tax=Curtobacterium sp. Leaf261 TaxID=1736311 RepID=UPI0006FD42BC|nr:histidine kinase [Curtobacterium sp. Leaf261]KQO61328.1 hypothetical protein ASF23_12630 [Curtobacterium sp. Leaf261]
MTSPRVVVAAGIAVVLDVLMVGFVAATGSAILVVLAQLVLVLLAAVIAVGIRYRVLGARHRAAALATAAARERARIAEEMHDALGHQLAVVALRASALEVVADAETSDAAALVRVEAANAVERLHDVLDVLHGDDATPSERLDRAVGSMRRAGMDLDARIVVAVDRLDPGVAAVVAAVCVETLTNAARHASGTPVQLDVRVGAWSGTEVVVTNPRTPATQGARGSGLMTLRRRVESLGGVFDVDTGDDFIVRATLPREPSGPSQARPTRPGTRLIREVLAGGSGAAIAIAAFYAVAAHGAVLDPATFGALRVGEPIRSVATGLPADEARTRLLATAPHPGDWRCAQYTDGNVPLAMATFEVCTADGRIVRLDDLRAHPWT